MSALGPGVYNIQEYQQRPWTNQPGFNSSQLRWAKSVSLKDLDPSESQNTQVPGPGAYQSVSTIDQLKYKVQGKNVDFGSSERRFVSYENL